jgi:hypothetical protein
MSVKERIKHFIKTKNITISEFEKSIDSSNGYINSISKSIGLDKIEKILEKYTNLNIEWVLTGIGDMLKGNNIVSEDSPECYKKSEREKNLEYTIEVQKELISILKKKVDDCESDENIKAKKPS